MDFELVRDWRYSGGPDGPGGLSLPEGTLVGSISIVEGIPMTPDQLADAVRVKLVREVHEKEVAAVPDRKVAAKAATAKQTKQVLDE